MIPDTVITRHNNYFNGDGQIMVKASTDEIVSCQVGIRTQVKMEGNSVTLSLLTSH